MKFFLPLGTPEQALDSWQQLTAAGQRPIYSVTYEHEGSKIVVTVGQERQEYRRKTGPRGGYIKNADHERFA